MKRENDIAYDRRRFLLLSATTAALAAGGISIREAAARVGGSLTLVVPSVDSEDFDPIRFRSAGQHIFYPLVFDPFIAKDPKTGQLTAGLATSWEVGDGGKSWIVKLRQGVSFHDGSPFTAADAKFSIERYIGRFEKVAASGSERLAGIITSVDVIDDLTIVIKSAAGAPTIPFDLAIDVGSASAYVVPKTYIDKIGGDGFNKAPIGTGPFRFTSQEIGRQMTFKTNASYWGEVADVDSLSLKIVPELATRVAQLRSGEADIVSGIVGPAIPQLKSTSDVRIVAAEKGQLIYLVIGGMTNPSSPLSKPAVREALSIAIDRQAIVTHLLYGQGAPASLFGFPFSFGWPADADKYPAAYDPAKAKSLLSTAGYPSGFDLTLYAATEGRDFAQAIAQFWTAVGVKVDLQVREISQVLAENRSDAGKAATRISLVFGATGSGARADFGGLLHTYLAAGVYVQPHGDQELTDWVLKQASENDPTLRAKMLGEILKRVYQKNYVIPLYYADSLFAVGKSVASWQPIPGVGYPSNLNSVKRSI